MGGWPSGYGSGLIIRRGNPPLVRTQHRPEILRLMNVDLLGKRQLHALIAWTPLIEEEGDESRESCIL